jgi:short subunit dehydrogenase-like uncharacterized protein
MDWLIYGANGYSAQLIARLARERGLRPTLAGRDSARIAALAAELGCEQRVFALDDAATVARHLAGVGVVLHCAGPFAHTFAVMSAACLQARVHYLDITGEVAVFEALAARDRHARDAGVMLMPGVGFDVVPSDCLAAHLKRRLPTATRLTLGFQAIGKVSRGTATTMAENIGRGGLVRRGGKLVRVPEAWRTLRIDFGAGPTAAVTIPWGDVSTAYHSTGIPDIEVYMAAPRSMRLLASLLRVFGPLLATKWAQRYLKRRIQSGPPGPTDEERARGRSLLWGEACDDAGRRVASWLRGPEGYTLTALTALAVVERVLRGEAVVGFQTPAMAFGADFILEIPGVERREDGALTAGGGRVPVSDGS